MAPKDGRRRTKDERMDEAETGETTKVVTTGVTTGVWWRCRGCGQVLGLAAGEGLWLSVMVMVDERVRVRCRGCGSYRTWRPAPAGEGGGEWDGEVRRVG